MGLVAAIFAYLGGVTVLTVTLLMSAGALLYPSEQTTIAQQTITTAAKPRAAQTTPVSSAGNERSGSPGAKEETSADISNGTVPRPHMRRLVRQARAKDWLHQQEPKVFGSAEEPSASFLYDRFQ
jgi:hypothetical protein